MSLHRRKSLGVSAERQHKFGSFALPASGSNRLLTIAGIPSR